MTALPPEKPSSLSPAGVTSLHGGEMCFACGECLSDRGGVVSTQGQSGCSLPSPDLSSKGRRRGLCRAWQVVHGLQGLMPASASGEPCDLGQLAKPGVLSHNTKNRVTDLRSRLC